MMRHLLGIGAVLAGCMGLAACGGNVVVEGDDGVGGEDGGGAPAVACQQFCATASSAGCAVDSGCQGLCLESFEVEKESCRDELSAYVDCLTAALASTGCDLSTVCQPERLAAHQC